MYCYDVMYSSSLQLLVDTSLDQLLKFWTDYALDTNVISFS